MAKTLAETIAEYGGKSVLESLKVSGFRKYRELELKGFGRINCILGPNNIGKTSILEALYTWACGQNVIPLVLPLARGRYTGIQQPYWMMEELLALFKNHDLPLKMTFDGMNDGKRVCFAHTVYPSEILTEYDSSYKHFAENIIPRNNEPLLRNPRSTGQDFPGLAQLAQAMSNAVAFANAFAKWEILQNEEDAQTYDLTVPILQTANVESFHTAKFIDISSHITIGENVQIYSSLKREKLLDEFAKEINKVFPEITGFDMIPYPDGSPAPISVVKQNGDMLPIYAYGDGVQRWFYILGAIILHKGSIICIDEIDVGFHPAAQAAFCENLIRAARENNAQLFITTHNLEFIDSFLKAAGTFDEEASKDIKILTLRENSGGVAVRTLDSRMARGARDEFSLELR